MRLQNLGETQLAKENCAVETAKTSAVKVPNDFDLDDVSLRKLKDARREGMHCEDEMYHRPRSDYRTVAATSASFAIEVAASS